MKRTVMTYERISAAAAAVIQMFEWALLLVLAVPLCVYIMWGIRVPKRNIKQCEHG